LFCHDFTYGFFPAKWPKNFSWYDNEWDKNCRAGDLATCMAERELSAPLA
jgi:hypothetical protein